MDLVRFMLTPQASNNTANGVQALFDNTIGSNSTADGYQALYSNQTGSSDVALGYSAGYNEIGSNHFYVNNVAESSLANDKQYSLMYGVFSGSAASTSGQQLTINGNVGIGTGAPGGRLEVASSVTTPFLIDSNGNVGIGTIITSNAGLSVMNGNVGIGTWVPAYNLDLVNNTARERIYRRQVAVNAPASPVAINSDITDLYVITGLSNALTINITAGTPNNGDLLEIRIKDNATARALTWGVSGATISSTTTILPGTTVISQTLRILLEYNSTSVAWECIAVT